MNKFTVLGIETSCDETAASVYKTDVGVLSSVLFSQIDLQKEYGGVVPEVASRSHLEKIRPIIQKALDDAKCTIDDIDTIAITTKPGLPGSLLIGLCFGKTIAWAKQKKIIGVNHLEGHAFSSFLENNVPFPHLCLTASGGHTNLYLIHGFGDYIFLGQTLDDAAGEAFDKIAKLINLPYPGGPEIEKLAKEANFQDFFKYPRGQANTLNFSFSGLKTAIMYDLIQRGAYDLKAKKFLKEDDLELKKQVASSLLVCVKDIFMQKLNFALKSHPQIKSVSFVGGVACNKYLKSELRTFCETRNIQFFSPSPKYCTDNAAMIAFVGHYKAQQGKFDDLNLDIF
ncbi:MAG: tRNA (adenosine(37)-N6)-threonylcarbamoyltransferase complex transferase subunit TsaD [Candidatus Babeliales bacterium]|nr:tRNA (adenosine(37)-N6)-threonylcarbamoyltransferase complex transferase subunit TsaD [Candidatus Babeliales bacterium]